MSVNAVLINSFNSIFQNLKPSTHRLFRTFARMKHYWYLREGDFLPEQIESLCQSWRRSRRSIVEFLSQSGNIFTSKESAEEASKAVRAALIAHQALQGRLAEIRIDVDIPPYGEG